MLIMWSGGCDSTLALANALSNLVEDGQVIRTVSVTHPQVPPSVQQRRAREAIIKHYFDRGVRWDSSEVEVEIYGSCTPNDTVLPELMLGQVVPFLQRDEDLVVGWIKSDNAMHWLEGIRAMFDGMQRTSQRTGRLLLPLEWHTKGMVIVDLKKHRGLYSRTWWCEGPGGDGWDGVTSKPCGRCQPCLTHRTALWQIKNDADFKLNERAGVGA